MNSLSKFNSTVSFRFYEELNDFLPAPRKKVEFDYAFPPNQIIKEIIESIGVPHTEIDLILVNGQSVDFSYLLQKNDRVSVYPKFEALDISPINHLRPEPLRDPKFILDVHLGKLAKHLRLLGFDVLFDSSLEDENIAKISAREHRIVLTRDKGLLKNNRVTHGYWVRKIHPEEQIKEIVDRFDLTRKVKPFTRCLECNDLLVTVNQEEIKEYLPQNTTKYYQKFNQCPSCHKVYWKGSHYQKMEEFINKIIK